MVSDLRDQLLRQLTDYKSEYPEELIFRERFVRLIRQHQNCFERSLLSGHITGSAWIVNFQLTHTFLTHHAKLNRWLQPGGHADGDEDVAGVALKEALEETGMKSLKLYDGLPFDLDIHTIPERKGVPEHEHFDIRYLILTDMDQQFSVSDESNDLAWWPLDRVPEVTGTNDSIIRMIKKVEDMQGKLSAQAY